MVGMGLDLYQRYPLAQELFHQADDILGFPLSELSFRGPRELLSDTVNTQPAILTVSVACLRILQSQVQLVPSYVAGHSLGEFSALVAAGAVDFPAALRLTRERGRLMKEAGSLVAGGMAAVIQLGEQELTRLCREASDGRGSVQIANYNSPGQLVIAGERKALERAMALAKARGARRVIPLTVSIAGHSPLMRPAAEKLAEAIAQERFHSARIPLVANTCARPIKGVAEIKEELVAQLTSPLRWVQSVRHMVELGVGTFVELGPGNVLSGLTRRIDDQLTAIAVGDVAGMERLLANLKERWI